MKTIGLLGLCCVAMALLAREAFAHEGVTMMHNRCIMRIGPYLMSYNGYQPETQSFADFCDDLPNAGRTLIVLDVEQMSGSAFTATNYNDLRDMAIDFRVLRNVGQSKDEENIDQNTEAYLPPRKYPLGTLQFEHNFATGQFIGLVSARDDHGRIFVSRFPFSVGPTKLAVLPFAVGGLVLTAAIAGFFLARRRSAA